MCWQSTRLRRALHEYEPPKYTKEFESLIALFRKSLNEKEYFDASPVILKGLSSIEGSDGSVKTMNFLKQVVLYYDTYNKRSQNKSNQKGTSGPAQVGIGNNSNTNNNSNSNDNPASMGVQVFKKNQLKVDMVSMLKFKHFCHAVTGFVRENEYDFAMECFEMMQDRNIVPNTSIFKDLFELFYQRLKNEGNGGIDENNNSDEKKTDKNTNKKERLFKDFERVYCYFIKHMTIADGKTIDSCAKFFKLFEWIDKENICCENQISDLNGYFHDFTNKMQDVDVTDTSKDIINGSTMKFTLNESNLNPKIIQFCRNDKNSKTKNSNNENETKYDIFSNLVHIPQFRLTNEQSNQLCEQLRLTQLHDRPNNKNNNKNNNSNSNSNNNNNNWNYRQVKNDKHKRTKYEQFIKHLHKDGGSEVIIDGANIGHLVFQNCFSYQMVDDIAQYFINLEKKVRIVLTSHRVYAAQWNQNSMQVQMIIQKWLNEGLLYIVAPCLYDDVLWAIAALYSGQYYDNKSKSEEKEECIVPIKSKQVIVVTNDLMRDHKQLMKYDESFQRFLETKLCRVHINRNEAKEWKLVLNFDNMQNNDDNECKDKDKDKDKDKSRQNVEKKESKAVQENEENIVNPDNKNKQTHEEKNKECKDMNNSTDKNDKTISESNEKNNKEKVETEKKEKIKKNENLKRNLEINDNEQVDDSPPSKRQRLEKSENASDYHNNKNNFNNAPGTNFEIVNHLFESKLYEPYRFCVFPQRVEFNSGQKVGYFIPYYCKDSDVRQPCDLLKPVGNLPVSGEYILKKRVRWLVALLKKPKW